MIILVMLILFALLIGISYYLAVRTHKGLIAFFPGCRLWPVWTFFIVLTLMVVLCFARSMLPFPNGVKHVIGGISAYCIGIYIYLFLFTVVAHFLTFLLHFTKAPFMARPHFTGFVTIGVLLATAITCIAGFVNTRSVNHVSYEVQLDGLAPDSNLNVVMISDLHLGAAGSESRLGKIVDEINNLEPDLICIAGDFFDTDFGAIQNPERAIDTLRRLNATYGVYACLGNHDAGKTFPKMTDFIEKANIQLLNDEAVVINERLVLVGRVDSSPIGGYGPLQRKDFTQILTPEMKNLPVVVLDHNPANIHEYGEEADLILCGHTHKGQLFPANIITNLMYTVDYGYYQKDAKSPQVIVSSGVGYWGMPMRVGTQCEIVSIRIG